MTQDNSIVKNRLACIDILRGFDMFFLVGAGEVLRRLIRGFDSPALEPLYRQFQHVNWEGFVAWDLIMPLFLFTSGLSMPFSFGKLLASGYTKAKIYAKVLKRFCILFFLGWIAGGNLLDLKPDTFLIYSNTLQSIAFGYLITALIVLNCKKVSVQLSIGVSLVVVYWALLAFAPVPGVGRGVITPDGNFAMYIDRLVFGSLMNPKSQYTWMLSSLAFGATVFSGYYAGLMLKEKIANRKKLIRLVLVGIVLIVAGLLLDLHQPIVKKIWSSAMVLFSSGICFLLLALSFLITDMMKIDSWWTRGLRIYGLNAITAYMIHQCLQLRSIAQYLMHGFEQYTGTFYPMIVALCQFGILFFILNHMYKHKIFLKI